MLFLTMCMELAQRVDNGKVAITGESRQCEDRYANGDILHELRNAAQKTAPGPILDGIDCRDQRHGSQYDQQIGQRQGKDVAEMMKKMRKELNKE